MTSPRDRRVTLALKWHYLDNLSAGEIQERFEQEGYGSYARSTIRGYLNDSAKEEVIEQIEAEQADVRLQIAEREERMYQRARDAESMATEDQAIIAMVPKMDCNQTDEKERVSDWEQLPPGDDRRPEWATERDVVITFTDDARWIEPGDGYPAGAKRGRVPEYRKAVVGLERDQPDLKGQAMARQEQSSHLEQKGEALGVYSTDINMNVDGEMETSVSLDEETAAAIREATLDDE